MTFQLLPLKLQKSINWKKSPIRYTSLNSVSVAFKMLHGLIIIMLFDLIALVTIKQKTALQICFEVNIRTVAIKNLKNEIR